MSEYRLVIDIFLVIELWESSPHTPYIQKGIKFKLYMQMNGKIQFWNKILPILTSIIGISFFNI